MTPSSSMPVVNLNDHAAAAAYLMGHADAIALVVLDGQWPGRPVAIITKADIVRAVAAGADLNNVRVRDLLAGKEIRAGHRGVRAGAGSTYRGRDCLAPTMGCHVGEPDEP
jgi:CBS domain-containing protein